MQIFSNTNYDFIRWRWHAIVLSLVVILGGVGLMVSRGGLPLGIDFSGGTIVVLKFQQATSEDTVRKAVEAIPGEKVVQTYGAAADHEILVRLPVPEGRGLLARAGARSVVDGGSRRTSAASRPLYLKVVGPVIGKDLQSKGIYADARVDSRHHPLHRVPVPPELCRRRHRGDLPRHPGHRRLPVVLR